MAVAICCGVLAAAGFACDFAWAGAEVLVVFAGFVVSAVFAVVAAFAAVAFDTACEGWAFMAAVMAAVMAAGATVPASVGEVVAAKAAVAVPPTVPTDISPAAAKPTIRVRLVRRIKRLNPYPLSRAARTFSPLMAAAC
jgi:hypothetical protein